MRVHDPGQVFVCPPDCCSLPPLRQCDLSCRLRISLRNDKLQDLIHREETRQQQLHGAICSAHMQVQVGGAETPGWEEPVWHLRPQGHTGSNTSALSSGIKSSEWPAGGESDSGGGGASATPAIHHWGEGLMPHLFSSSGLCASHRGGVCDVTGLHRREAAPPAGRLHHVHNR